MSEAMRRIAQKKERPKEGGFKRGGHHDLYNSNSFYSVIIFTTSLRFLVSGGVFSIS
jgi:hypothetical protein